MSGRKTSNKHSRPKKRDRNIVKTTKSAKLLVSPKKRNKQSVRKKKGLKQNRKRKKRRTTQIKRWLVELGVSLVMLGILLYLLSFFIFSFAKISGYSMTPTLSNAEVVFVNKLAKPKRFKLILYKDRKSKKTSVRRVIGMPGETIRYKSDKLYINDQEVFERFLEPEIRRAKSAKTVFTEDWTQKTEVIPKGKYLVLGDNRPYAADSREYGYIARKEIVGIVEMRILPIHQMKQF